MTARSVLPLVLVVLVGMMVVFLTFTNTYMACADRQGAVVRERANLFAMCDNLSTLDVQLGTLAYKFLPNGKSQIVVIDNAKSLLDARASMADVAAATDLLAATASNLVGSLNGSAATNSGEYADVRAKLGDTLHQVVIAKTAYNNAIAVHNTELDQPIARLWRGVMGFKPAEPCVQVKKRPARSLDTSTPPPAKPPPPRTATAVDEPVATNVLFSSPFGS